MFKKPRALPGVHQAKKMRFPLNKTPHPSRDSWGFEKLNLATACPLPLAPHPGAFAVERSKHIHEGVDLYGLVGEPAFCVEDAIVVAVIDFTGEAAGSGWWLPTKAVMAQGAHGVWVYGEVDVPEGMAVGDRLKEGDPVGTLARVLRNDKGRPTCMLHVELRAPGGSLGSDDWPLGQQKPRGLLDPTPALAAAAGWHALADALLDGDEREVDACLRAGIASPALSPSIRRRCRAWI